MQCLVFPTCWRGHLLGLASANARPPPYMARLSMTMCVPWPQECDPVEVPSEEEPVARPAADPLLQPPPASRLQQPPEEETLLRHLLRH